MLPLRLLLLVVVVIVGEERRRGERLRLLVRPGAENRLGVRVNGE